jgi:hypothetical protein
MDAFQRELMRRSPLAGCVLEVCDHIFDDQLLDSIWAEHRGRCYEDVLRFGDFLHIMRDALVRHGGSAHKLFLELEKRKAEPVNESSFYRKLSHIPVDISRSLLREGTQRLSALMPGPAVTLAACFDDFAVIVGDGKKIKNAAKRLKPTRGYEGSLIGAKALVGLDARSGLALAMSDSLDGMTNDVPLVPALMEQLRQILPGPILSIWDRQFDDVRTLGHLSVRSGDCYVVRMKQKHTFVAESAVKTIDEQGRQVHDEIGLLGKGKAAVRVRRITLFRPGEDDDVVLLTNLLDRVRYVPADLLELYRHRWGIEQVFQQVTETFSLTHLIGSAPQAVLLQFSYCLLLYNLMQVIKVYVAEDGGVLASVVSMYYLFDDARKELEAWAYHTDGNWPRAQRDAAAMRRRLRELLKGSWDPVTYTKAADKKPRPAPRPRQRLHGGHSSVQRALEGRAKVVAK